MEVGKEKGGRGRWGDGKMGRWEGRGERGKIRIIRWRLREVWKRSEMNKPDMAKKWTGTGM